jgi:phage terminase small subunit
MNAVVEHKPDESAYDRLPRRHRRFVDAYVAGHSGAESMRLARCKSLYPHNRAWELLQRPEIRAAIDERERHAVAEAGVRHLRIVQELHRIATCDPRKLVNGEGVAIPLHELPEEVAACIASVDVENISINGETGTRYKYRFWDKNKALDKLGQYLKLWDAKGPTVNVDARSVTNNTVHVGGGEAIRAVAELGRAIAAIGASQSLSSPDPNGSLLPAPVRDEPKGRGASVDAGQDQGSSGEA